MDDGIDPLWLLAESLSVREAAALIAGYDPSDLAWMDGETVLNRDWPRQYPAEVGLRNAVLSGAVPLLDRPADIPGWADDGPIRFMATAVRVSVDDVRAWLANRGMRTGFFFPSAAYAPDYLDPNNPRYAPKLAAAVRAWQATTDQGGKTPKQAVMKWLREHATYFNLIDDEGRPNETGIEEVAKVANWQPGGGAPKTPGG
jgi:hypothetical protein